MITVITGLTGSGKTWLMSRLMLREWKNKTKIFSNFPVYFSDNNEGVSRWNNLSEIYNVKSGMIAIDEGQKLFDSRLWSILPISFSEKIAQHRHHLVDIITTTQDLGHIDVRVRNNIHELYNCKSIFRFPKSDRVKPIFQVIKIIRKERTLGDTGLKWVVVNHRFKFISKYFTKELYNTYGNLDLPKFVCHIKREKGKWRGMIYSREIYNQSKVRW